MGPTNEALLKLYDADRALRVAQDRLDAATRGIRAQQRAVEQAARRKEAADTALRERHAASDGLNLDVKARDEHIDKLRGQQQNARNNKEYQALLMEISTEKVDRGKVEEQALTAMQAVEEARAERDAAASALEAESAAHARLSADQGERVAALQSAVDALRPDRDAAATAVPPTARAAYERLADRYEGEALSPVEKPDERQEMYVCGACNMELRVDVFYRLHSRDDLVACDSCRRLLYLPPGMTPESALNQKKPEKKPKADKPPKSAKVAKPSAGPSEGWKALLDESAEDSAGIAADEGAEAVECGVLLDGHLVGFYRAKSPEHFERTIRRKMESTGLYGLLQVHERATIEAT